MSCLLDGLRKHSTFPLNYLNLKFSIKMKKNILEDCFDLTSVLAFRGTES
jgi:hypothetical protein